MLVLTCCEMQVGEWQATFFWSGERTQVKLFLRSQGYRCRALSLCHACMCCFDMEHGTHLFCVSGGCRVIQTKRNFTTGSAGGGAVRCFYFWIASSVFSRLVCS